MLKHLCSCVFYSFLLLASHFSSATELKIAYFSQDPPSIDPLSSSFDPDSYSVIAQIFDSLVYMDLEGQFKPGLATDWQQISANQWKFQLRRNVKFHNGEAFNAHAVKFTFDFLLNKQHKSGNAWILNTIKRAVINPKNLYEITLETHQPDTMLLNRLNLFGSICPPNYIQQKGFAHFQKNPIGTGPFMFASWQPNQDIQLIKNPNYWEEGKPQITKATFVMLDKTNWVDAFVAGEIDLIPNLNANKSLELLSRSKGKARIIQQKSLVNNVVLLRNQGILANVNIRKALNYAVNKNDLIRFADFGNALVLPSLGKQGEFGAATNLHGYAYDPEKAINLLKAELGENYAQTSPKLSALISHDTENVAKIIQRNLLDVGITLNITLVSRPEWSNRIVGYKLKNKKPANYDLVINLVSNPIYHLAFHAGVFLDSRSPWSLLSLDEFDQQLQQALSAEMDQIITSSHISEFDQQQKIERKLQALDTYIHDQALMIFTTQKIITSAVNNKFDIKQLSLSGHLNYQVLSNVQMVEPHE